MKKVVVLTGAGISAESGLKTFRDSGGLWEGYNVNDVATPEAWQRDPALVLDFYNKRRKNCLEANPNAGHLALAELEQHFDVHVITQNVDNLHERAGSTKVLHLHGELLKVRSTRHPHIVYDWNIDLHIGDRCENGGQLRPHIVWFGEMVPAMEEAVDIASQADIFLVVGTSLLVYPAAGLVHYVRREVDKYVIDPASPPLHQVPKVRYINTSAAKGTPELVKRLIADEQLQVD